MTTGTVNGTNIAFYSKLLDVRCALAYARDRDGLEKLISSYQLRSTIRAEEKEPLLVNECVRVSDIDEVRGATHRYYWELLSAAGLGCMPLSIQEGRSAPPAAIAWMAPASTPKATMPPSTPTAPSALDTTGCTRNPSSAQPGRSNRKFQIIPTP